jgi:hypothetical protein
MYIIYNTVLFGLKKCLRFIIYIVLILLFTAVIMNISKCIYPFSCNYIFEQNSAIVLVQNVANEL